MVQYMDEKYLSKESLLKKSQNWMNSLELSKSRMKKFRFELDKTALFVIDMQSFFLSKDSHAFIPSSRAIIPNVNSLINIYRKKDLPIIFTYHCYLQNEDPGIMQKWWGDVLLFENPHSRIDSSIDWSDEDITIRKTKYSAFIGTNLDDLVRNMHIEQIIITGVMTHLCCETTARDAFMKDYVVYFVVDSTATDNESLHVSSLRTLSDGFVIPVRTRDILEEIKLV